MTTRRHFVQSSSALAARGTLLPLVARAQELEQVKIINGFPAGGTADATSRRIGEQLRGSNYTPNAAVVENKPGAGGRIGLPAPLHQAQLRPFQGLDACVDCRSHAPRPGGRAHGSSLGQGGQRLCRLVQGQPGQGQLWLAGGEFAAALPGRLLSSYTNVPMQHVPYRGSVPGVTDLIGGQLASMFTPSGDFLANHKAGEIRIMVTSGPTRSPFSPEVPTFAEQGFAELTTEEWFGFYAPAKTPDNIIDNANAAINAALKNPTVISSLGTFGLVPAGSTVREMDKSQRDAYFRWGPLVKHLGFTGMS